MKHLYPSVLGGNAAISGWIHGKNKSASDSGQIGGGKKVTQGWTGVYVQVIGHDSLVCLKSDI